MKLAIVSPVFPPYRSGMGTVVQENARMAAEAGYETCVLTPRYRAVHTVSYNEKRDSYTIHRLFPLFSFGNAALVPQLFLALRRADTIHFHYPALGMEIPVLFWSLLGKKVVITYHMDLVGKGVIMRAVFRLYSAIFLPLVMRCSSIIFVTSYDYAATSPLIGSWFKRYRKKFAELPCSVDTKRFFPPVLGPPMERHPSILFVGTLDAAHYSKGVSVLLEALSLVCRDPSTSLAPMDCKFVIIGDGNMRKSYEERARALGVADHVHFAGSVGHDELPRWYAGARCLVLPSTDATEAFGVVIIEAAASGIPAIASNLRGVRSVIEDEVTGFLVEPRNAHALQEKIRWMIDHPYGARRMGATARTRSTERYAYEVVREKYIRSISNTEPFTCYDIS